MRSPRTDRGRWAEPAARRFGLRLAGVLYIGVTMLLVIAAVNSQNNLLFIAFGLGIAGLLLSGVISGAGMMALRVRREGPVELEAGTPGEIRYRLRNVSGWLPVFAVHLEETLGDSGEVVRAFAAWVPARADVVIRGRVTPKRRGVLALSGLSVWTEFPLGIARKSIRQSLAGEAIIRPARYEIDRVPTPRPRSSSRSRVRRRRRVRGQGEFFALREYTPGDPMRSIAWKRTASLGRPVIREAISDPNRRVFVRLSTSGGAGHGGAGDGGAGDGGAGDELAISAALALVERLEREGWTVGLLAGDRRVGLGRGPTHRRRIVRALALLDAHSAGEGVIDPGPDADVLDVASEASRGASSADLVARAARRSAEGGG